jgi:hypothetical protein
MESNSNKFSNILVNIGGRRNSSHASNDRRHDDWRGDRPEFELVLSPVQSALMGTIGRPWA